MREFTQQNTGRRPAQRPASKTHAPSPAPRPLRAAPVAPPVIQHATYFTEGVFSKLSPAIQHAIHDAGYNSPTPIQSQAIPALLNGRDILGSAQTGTGKTAAFVLPILQQLSANTQRPQPNRPRVLILAPTRELAAQIGESVTTYGRHLRITRTVIYGGVKQHTQVSSLEQGKHIVIATPGRLIDLIQQKHAFLDSVETFVLDEADRMLDMGFLPDIRRVISYLPKRRQSLFFSATLSPTILELANTLVQDPVRIEIAPEQPAVERIVQKVLFVNRDDKDNLLVNLLNSHAMNRVIVFTQMKHVANKVARKLTDAAITAEVIHGNKSQNARINALDKFKQGEVRVLVATDIAARGIDVDSITHVINYDLPLEPETYVHRIGRTARAGTEGDAISFCCAQERDFLRAIEKLILIPIPQDTTHSYHDESARNARGADARPAPRGGRGDRGGRDNGRERANLLKPIKYSSGPKWRRSGSH